MKNNAFKESMTSSRKSSDEILKMKQVASVLFNQENFAEALEIFQIIIASAPSDEYAILGSGACQFELNDNESAKNNFLKVLKINGSNFDALGNLAKIYFKNKNYSESINYYNKCLILNPADKLTNLNLGLAYQEAGDWKSALLHFENAKNETNQFEISLLKGDLLSKVNQFSAALAEFEIALSINRDNTIPIVKIGNLYFNNQNYNLAFESFKKVQQLSPKDPLGYFNLGGCAYKCQSYIMAIYFYSEAIHINPNFSEAIFHLGICYDSIKQKKLAFDCFETAHQKDPLNLKILFELASKYKIFNLLEDSLLCYKKILEIDFVNIKAAKEIPMLNSQIIALNSISTFDFVSEIL